MTTDPAAQGSSSTLDTSGPAVPDNRPHTGASGDTPSGTDCRPSTGQSADHHPECPYRLLQIQPADCFHCHRLGWRSSTTGGTPPAGGGSWATGTDDIKSRIHDPLCPSAYTMACECHLIGTVRQDEHDTTARAAIATARAREAELLACGKPDNCRTYAHMAGVIAEDLEYLLLDGDA